MTLIEAVATLQIPSAGPWTFGVNSDDGFFPATREQRRVIFESQFFNPRGPMILWPRSTCRLPLMESDPGDVRARRRGRGGTVRCTGRLETR